MRTLIRLFRDSQGLTTLEYGLIAVFVAVGLVFVAGLLGENLAATYEHINRELQSRF